MCVESGLMSLPPRRLEGPEASMPRPAQLDALQKVVTATFLAVGASPGCRDCAHLADWLGAGNVRSAQALRKATTLRVGRRATPLRRLAEPSPWPLLPVPCPLFPSLRDRPSPWFFCRIN